MSEHRIRLCNKKKRYRIPIITAAMRIVKIEKMNNTSSKKNVKWQVDNNNNCSLRDMLLFYKYKGYNTLYKQIVKDERGTSTD